jgi:hypothetical protein
VKILITGSRDWPASKMQAIFFYLDKFRDAGLKVELLHGECPVGGVDAYCAAYGHGAGWNVRAFPPRPSDGRTELYPKDYAIRNQAMVDEMPDLVLAFFLHGAGNRGTKMTVDMAVRKKLYVEEIWE